MSYKAYVVEIKELRKHSNADRLQIATVFGNDVIVGLNIEVGQKMVYFPTDGQLSKDFAEDLNLIRNKDESGKNTGGYLDPLKRNIRAMSLRGEKSDGLLVSLSDMDKFLGKGYADKNLKVGDSFDTLDGKLICKKYIPVAKVNKIPSVGKKVNKKSLENVYPLFKKHEDTSQLAYNLHEIKDDDDLTITLKVHGTSARTAYVTKEEDNWKAKLLKKLGINLAKKWGIISGSRRVILTDYDGGFYGDNMFRKKYNDFFEGKLQKGETIFYEIVGYVEKGKPIMGVANNKKMKDKKFVKEYGETTTFNYGLEDGESDIYVYRMNMTNEDGDVVEYPTWLAQIRCEQMGVKHVPILGKVRSLGSEINKELAIKYIQEELAEGPDPIGKTHVREGVVVRVENRSKFTAYKHKGFAFKVLEGIIKEDAVEPDMEEVQESLEEEVI